MNIGFLYDWKLANYQEALTVTIITDVSVGQVMKWIIRKWFKFITCIFPVFISAKSQITIVSSGFSQHLCSMGNNELKN